MNADEACFAPSMAWPDNRRRVIGWRWLSHNAGLLWAPGIFAGSVLAVVIPPGSALAAPLLAASGSYLDFIGARIKDLVPPSPLHVLSDIHQIEACGNLRFPSNHAINTATVAPFCKSYTAVRMVSWTLVFLVGLARLYRSPLCDGCDGRFWLIGGCWGRRSP